MYALSSAIDVTGGLGIILFEQSPAKCFTSILADVYYTIGLGDIVFGLHDHCHHHDLLHTRDLANNHDMFSLQ